MSWNPTRFIPARGLAGPHAQTMVGRLIRRPPEVMPERERWTTPDGDFVDVDILEPPPGDQAAASGSVLILHGLEGSSTRSYVRELMAHARADGLRTVALNFRSCSGEPNRRAESYHAGATPDVAFALAEMRSRWAGPLGAAGFSLGGNVLLKHLAERGTHALPDAAVVVSVPFDLAAGARRIGHGLAGRVYTHYFLRSLRRKLLQKRDLLDPAMLREGLAAADLVAFDEAVTAPLHGFRDAADYYARSSSAPLLPEIATPTLVVHAADDPFQPRPDLPTTLQEAPAVRVCLTAKGGHLGFMARPAKGGRSGGRRPMCWAERTAAAFLREALLGGTASVDQVAPDL